MAKLYDCPQGPAIYLSFAGPKVSPTMLPYAHVPGFGLVVPSMEPPLMAYTLQIPPVYSA